jgi:hypothetical protein
MTSCCFDFLHYFLDAACRSVARIGDKVCRGQNFVVITLGVQSVDSTRYTTTILRYSALLRFFYYTISKDELETEREVSSTTFLLLACCCCLLGESIILVI